MLSRNRVTGNARHTCTDLDTRYAPGVGDVTTTLRRIECDGCGAVEETEPPMSGIPARTKRVWTTVAVCTYSPTECEEAHQILRLCERCGQRAIDKLNDLKAEAERLKGGTVPRGWP